MKNKKNREENIINDIIKQQLDIWENAKYKPSHFNPDTDTAFKKVLLKIEKKKQNGTFIRKVYRIAAVMFLFLGIYFVSKSVLSEKYQTYSTTKKEIKKISLPDGSLVWINENTQIKHSYNNKNTHIILTGEAFFQIYPQKNNKFTITTEDITTEVKGTAFQVSHQNNNTKISVTEGTVLVKQKNKNILSLSASEEFIYNNFSKKYTKQTFMHPNFLAWKTKTLSYQNTSLIQIIKDIEKLHHLKIKIIGKDLNICNITTTFDNISAMESLEILATLTHGNIIKNENENEIIFQVNSCGNEASQ